MDDPDNILKDALARGRKVAAGPPPTDDEWLAFAEGRLSSERLEAFLAWLSAHPEDLERARAIRRALESSADDTALEAPRALVQRAKALRAARQPASVACPHCRRPLPFRAPLGRRKALDLVWLALATASFATSFFMPRYFVQWVALAVFFGFKWAIDRKATRTQIFVYKSLAGAASEADAEDLQNTRSHL
jgi:anti-sigma factor RsiW